MGTVFFCTVSYQLCNTPEYHLYIRSLGVQHLLHYPEWYIERNYEQSWENYVNNMARQGTWADNIIIQAVANSLNVTINIIESNAIFSPVTIVNPVNTDGQTTNIYIGHIQEYHYVSTMPALSLITPEITCDSGLIKKSVSSHEDRVEHCKESHFSQKKQSQLANEEKDDGRGTNIPEADNTDICKPSKIECIQKKQENVDYRQKENRMRSVGLDSDTDMEERQKIENHKTSKRQFMQKKCAQAVNPKRIKLSEVDKAEKRKATKRECI